MTDESSSTGCAAVVVPLGSCKTGLVFLLTILSTCFLLLPCFAISCLISRNISLGSASRRFLLLGVAGDAASRLVSSMGESCTLGGSGLEIVSFFLAGRRARGSSRIGRRLSAGCRDTGTRFSLVCFLGKSAITLENDDILGVRAMLSS